MDDARPSHRRDLDAYLAAGLRRALRPGNDDPSVIVVTGAGGAGKSHALRQAVSEAAPAVARSTAVSELPRPGPYAVVADLLGAELGRPVPADTDGLLLARLDDLCAAAPLLLVVDDVHEADAASLAVLSRMASTARDLPLALLLARRPRPRPDQLTRLLHHPGVREVSLPAMDDMDLDVLVHERTGRWPDRRLRSALAAHRDNALRLLTLLDDLDRIGAVTAVGEVLKLLPGPEAERAARGDLDATIAATVSTLQGPARQAARALAVLGRPAAPEEVAAVAGASAVTIVEPLQMLMDRGVVAVTRDGRLAFTHDSHRDAVARDIPAPLLRVLHAAAAAAAHEQAAERVRHVVASGAAPEEVLSAVRAAGDHLANAPDVEADLLAPRAVTAVSSAAATELAVRRTRALARSGQMSRAENAALAALAHATDPSQTVELRRVLIFVRSVRGDAKGALALIDEALDGPVSPHVRDILGQHRRQLVQLAGLQPLPLRPPDPDPLALTLTGMTAEAVRLCLTGHAQPALELTWEASRRHMSAGTDPYEGASSDLWPPFVELLTAGPAAAEAAMRDMQRLRGDRSAHWQSAPHQLLRASIDMSAGRLADAAVGYDTGLEAADVAELAWTSLAVGARALLDVLTGEPDAAHTRLHDWDAAPRTLHFGIPQPGRARVSLLEARRHHSEAARLGRDVWKAAADLNLLVWLAVVAPELSRVARRAGDEELRAMIARDLTRLSRPLPPALAPSVRLAEALTDADGRDTAGRARAAAAEAQRIGEALTELAAREEAAVAAAREGDRDQARRDARHALDCAERAGAAGVAQRISARMRSAGIRVGPAGRRRPRTGWNALTPAETQVAELVASGLSGPDIARSLNVSTRTVQTHVSHTLAKLGLANRLELAAAARDRPAPEP